MRAVITLSIAALVTGCGQSAPTGTGGSIPSGLSTEPGATERSAASAPVKSQRPRELINPDHTTMVLLYFELAGLPVPVEQAVQNDIRVQVARPADKPAQRELVRRELAAGMEGVKRVGTIRLTLQAKLSEYDSTYGEFTVRALAPSSMVEFKALDRKVQLHFANARHAQVWRVPAAQAQAVRDRIGFSGDVSVDTLLAVRDVHAAPEGGTINVDVIEYELRENRGGTLLGRVQLAKGENT